MNRTKSLMTAAISVAMMSLAGTALAGSASGSLSATATVNTNCTVNSPTLSFAAIDPTAGVNSTGTATISVACTKSTTLTDIKLGPGAHQIASGSRQLANGGVFIAYALYTDAANTTPWGDSTTTGIGNKLSTGFSSFSSVATPQTFTVYGNILAAAEDVPANTYTDSVAVTVDF